MSEPTNPAVVLAMIQRTCLIHLRFATLLCTVMYIDRSIQINNDPILPTSFTTTSSLFISAGLVYKPWLKILLTDLV